MIHLTKMKVQEIRGHLLNGVSWGEISKKTKVSSRLIAKVARTLPVEEVQDPTEGIVYPDMEGAYAWCEECCVYVKQPCLACQIRALNRRKRV